MIGDTISGSATGCTQGALDRVSGTMSDPLMCLMSVENSAMYDTQMSFLPGDLSVMLLKA